MELLLPSVPKELLTPPPQKKLKVVLAGETCVGKSSYFERVNRRYANPRCRESRPTVAMAFTNVLVRSNGTVVGDACNFDDDTDGRMVGLWDTAGQERFESLLPMYMRGADLVIVMHEGTERSMNRAKKIIATVADEVPNALVYMIQNKSDACAFQKEFLAEVQDSIIGWSHTSALSGENIESSFFDAVRCHDIARAAKCVVTELVPSEKKDGFCVTANVPFWQRGWC
jgi:small GTP-binding protein